MAEEHKPLPISGYRSQSADNVFLVNQNKEIEENILRVLDQFKTDPEIDQRWLAIGRTHLEQAFMAVNRAIFKPARVTFAGEEQ